MPLIKTINIRDAREDVEKIYLEHLKVRGDVPPAIRMFSASPGLLEIYKSTHNIHSSGDGLSFLLVSYIRLLTAHHFRFQKALEYYRVLLRTRGGILPKWIDGPINDPACAPLPEKEKALLLFALKAVKNPEEIEDEDMCRLRDQGWTDGEILEAVHTGASMKMESALFTAFNMDRDS